MICSSAGGRGRRPWEKEKLMSKQKSRYDEMHEPVDGIVLIKHEGKYGFINVTRNITVSPRYELIAKFKDGRAPFKLDGKWGLLDDTGKILVPARWDALPHPFPNGRVPVKADGLWGWINLSGTVIVYPRYTDINYVNDDFALVETDKNGLLTSWVCVVTWMGNQLTEPAKWKTIGDPEKGILPVRFEDKAIVIMPERLLICDDFNFNYIGLGLFAYRIRNKWGFRNIDQTGTDVIPCIYEDILTWPYYFKEKLIAVKKDGKWGVINKHGMSVIDFQFETLGQQGGDLIPFKNNGKWGFLDQLGKIVIDAVYDRVTLPDFHQTICVQQGDRWGYVNIKGKIVIPLRYEDVEPFFCAYAKVKENNKWGIIDLSGKYVVPPRYDELAGFEQDKGTLIFRYGNKWGVASFDNKILVKPEFDQVSRFSPDENLWQVEKKGLKGIIDDHGNIVIDCIYDSLGLDFYHGTLIMERDGKCGLIDRSGSIIIEPTFDYLEDFIEKQARFGLNGKVGLVDITGKIVIEPKYDDFSEYNYGMAAVKVSGKWGFVDTEGKMIIPPRFDKVGGWGLLGIGHWKVWIDHNEFAIDKTRRLSWPKT